jgi:hypothetical protein
MQREGLVVFSERDTTSFVACGVVGVVVAAVVDDEATVAQQFYSSHGEITRSNSCVEERKQQQVTIEPRYQDVFGAFFELSTFIHVISKPCQFHLERIRRRMNTGKRRAKREERKKGAYRNLFVDGQRLDVDIIIRRSGECGPAQTRS